MKMSGEEIIAAPIESVWAALNDPNTLKQCIPGCENITQKSPNAFSARVVVKLGPEGAVFAFTYVSFTGSGMLLAAIISGFQVAVAMGTRASGSLSPIEVPLTTMAVDELRVGSWLGHVRAMSAVASVTAPGVLVTATPRAVQSGTWMLS